MSDCCDNNQCAATSSPRRYACPANQEEYVSVSSKTILHHLKSPWEMNNHGEISSKQFYFCDDPACDVVYFSTDGSVIKKSQLRTTVGVKEINQDAMICYCFGVSRHDAKQHPEIKAFVTQQTKDKNCACEIRNPSGRCCLKDFH